MTRTQLTLLTAATLLAGCSHWTTASGTAPEAAAKPPEPPAVQRTLADVGLDIKAMDRTVDPCQDFYKFACGNWTKTTPIPPDRSRWSRSFNVIDERNKAILRHILEDAGQKADSDPVLQKIGAFYGSCIDEKTADKNGLAPIEKYLKIIHRIHDQKSLIKAIIELHRIQVWALFDLSSAQDAKDATKMIANLDQDGLGLPNRDFYLDDSPHMKEIRTFYEGHVQRMLSMAGVKGRAAAKATPEVIGLETALAKIAKSEVDRRDPVGMYNKIDRDGLKKAMPDFPWDEYFKALGHPDITEISVTSVPYFTGLNELLKTTKPAVWRSYLEWQLIHATGPTLSNNLVNEAFALTKTITGQEQIQDRWKRCVESTDGALGELLAQPYVQEAFGGSSKATAQALIGDIRDAFGRNLTSLDWMDDATRAKAQGKLKAVSFLIGYPDKWKEYDWTVDAHNYGANGLAARAYELQRDLRKIGKPVDRGTWDMTPPTVNAYYDPQKNQMVFPAGILQPPFFSAQSSDAVNFGGIGMVMGHELTHGFDDEGAKFDAVGNLSDWWSPAVEKNFDSRGKCLADQYSGYTPLPGEHLNGKLTEGENIADNGGVKMAFSAYRALRANAPERVVADGFTEDQQFFLGVAQVWCSNQRDAATLSRLKTDPHSPAQFRVNGPLSNLPDFAEAFSCKAGTPMRPEHPCSVW